MAQAASPSGAASAAAATGSLLDEIVTQSKVARSDTEHARAKDIIAELVREVLEETACVFTPTHLQGIHLAPSASDDGVTYLRFAFTGSVGEPIPGRALDEGILRTLWLTPEEIAMERARHRSALLMRCIDDHRAGKRYPLALLQADASDFPALG